MNEKAFNVAEIPGWFDWAEWAQATVNALPEKAVYIEVGCFLGKSTCAIARMMQASGRQMALHAVDLFEVPATAEPELLAAVTAATGGLRVFQKQFEANLRRATRKDVGVPKGVALRTWAMSSLEASTYHADGSADVVFIDADHSYEALRADIAAWWPIVKPGGVMAGHDIHTYDSVFRAVHDAFNKVGGPKPNIIAGQNLWEVRKPC
jgi:predicted O-methyltransferase YrrM